MISHFVLILYRGDDGRIVHFIQYYKYKGVSRLIHLVYSTVLEILPRCLQIAIVEMQYPEPSTLVMLGPHFEPFWMELGSLFARLKGPQAPLFQVSGLKIHGSKPWSLRVLLE